MAEKRAAEAAEARAGAAGSGDNGGGAAGRAAPDALSAPNRGVVRKVMIGLVLLGLFSWVAARQRPAPPELAADCTNASFALSAEKVKQARLLQYTIVGPETKRYALGVNTRTWTRDPGGAWTPVPLPGREGAVIQAARDAPTTGCRRIGQFSLPVPLGEHTVTLYELRDTGAVEVASTTIEVTENAPD